MVSPLDFVFFLTFPDLDLKKLATYKYHWGQTKKPKKKPMFLPKGVGNRQPKKTVFQPNTTEKTMTVLFPVSPLLPSPSRDFVEKLDFHSTRL